MKRLFKLFLYSSQKDLEERSLKSEAINKSQKFKDLLISDIYLLKATDTLNEWRIKAKVLLSFKKRGFKL